MISRSEGGERVRETRKPAETSTVFCITADRPSYLRRCIKALAQNVLCDGVRHCEVVVVDGSLSPDAKRANRDACHSLASERLTCRHLLLRHVEAWTRTLCSRVGVSAEALQTPAQREGIGRARNAALLLSAGTPMVMLDDDVIARTWSPADPETKWARSDRDSRDWHFFVDRSKALASTRQVSANVVRELLSVVGSELRDVGGSTDASPRQIPTVRFGLVGVVGDSARYCPYHLLFGDGAFVQALQRDEAALECALKSREVSRIANQVVWSSVPWDTATYCAAIDNRRYTPPFLPAGRGEDTLFGVMLRLADPGALFAHLPYGIIHDSSRPSAYGDDALCGATDVRTVDVIHALLRQCAGSTRGDSGAAIGMTFQRFAELPERDCLDLLPDILLPSVCERALRLEGELRSTERSAAWRRKCEIYRDQLCASINGLRYFIPRDVGTSGVRGLQDTLGAFGRLLDVWPALWAQANTVEGVQEVASDKWHI
jgi:hypothetical protein